MSIDGSCELVFAGDQRTFRLGIVELLSLQERRDCGPMELLRRLVSEKWRVEDITETVRIALIGAGVEGKAAKALVEENIRPPHVAEFASLASAILMSAIMGDASEPVGKGEATTAAPEATTASPPSPSMVAVP